MSELTPLELAHQLKIAAQVTEKLFFHPLTDLTDARAEINRLGAYLQACETKLIRLMNGEHPPDTEPGSTQYGLALYILDNRHDVFRRLLGLPPTQITDAMLESCGCTNSTKDRATEAPAFGQGNASSALEQADT